MKKSFLLILLFLLSFNAFAQYPTPFVLEKIDSAKGTKSELFVKANEYIIKTFKTFKGAKVDLLIKDKQAGKIIDTSVFWYNIDNPQMNDKEAGKIIINGVIIRKLTLKSFVGLSVTTDYSVSFTLTIDVKENKYKCKLSDFILTELAFPANPPNEYSAGFNNERPKGGNGIQEKNWDRIKNDCWVQSNSLVNDLGVTMKANSGNW